MRVHRYRSLLALVVVLVATGVVASSPALVVAGAIPLAFVLQGALGRTPSLERLRVEREIDPETPLPGQPVTVTLTVEHDGDGSIPDLRAVDGVPAELGVADGTPRIGGALRAGGSLSTTYTLIADRGAYEFEEVRLRARNLGGTRVADATTTAAGDGAFECRVSTEDVPIRRETTPYAGPLATDTGGPGIEFYATREYQRGDPVKRINWRRYAKTGDLSTVEYREQRAAHVAVVVDSRPPAHVAPDASLPTGATLCAYAATLAVNVLSEAGHHVSLAALGTSDPVGGRRSPAWVSADEHESFAARAAAVCNAAASGTGEAVTAETAGVATDGGAPGRDSRESGGDREHERLRSHLPAGAQVLLCTPAADDAMIDLVESLLAGGHGTTVLSPQTSSGDVGGRVAGLRRASRLERMRLLGATVVDWERDERLPIALARSLETEVR